MFSHICKRSLFLLQREQHRIAAESDSPSEALARPKWDTPFNRALNILKGLPMDTRPSYGRVQGVEDGATWKKYYRETTEERKERRRLNEENIDKKVAIAVAAAVAAAKQEIAASYGVLVPDIVSWSRQNPNKEAADFPLSNFFGSSSTSVAPAPAPAPALAPAHSNPSSVSDVLSGASSLAELDALTVPVTPALFNKCVISRFHCLSDVSGRRHVFAGRRNPMHHIVHHQRPEGGRGEGDDSEAEGTIVPQPADPP